MADFPPKFKAQRDLERDNEKLLDKVWRLKAKVRRQKRKVRQLKRQLEAYETDAVSHKTIEVDDE